MSPRLNDHAAQFAAAFELLSFPAFHEQENVVKRQIDSFVKVESDHDKDFDVRGFIQRIVSLIPCTTTARGVWQDCCPDDLKNLHLY